MMNLSLPVLAATLITAIFTTNTNATDRHNDGVHLGYGPHRDRPSLGYGYPNRGGYSGYGSSYRNRSGLGGHNSFYGYGNDYGYLL